MIDPALLTCAERLQYDGYLRREQTNAAILGLAKGGWPSRRSSAAPAAAARPSVRSCAASGPMFPVPGSSLEPWLDRLDREWTTGAATEPRSGDGCRPGVSRSCG